MSFSAADRTGPYPFKPLLAGFPPTTTPAAASESPAIAPHTPVTDSDEFRSSAAPYTSNGKKHVQVTTHPAAGSE